MASHLHERVTITVALSPEQAFRFVAHDYFDNHAKWDPAVVEMLPRSSPPIGVGSAGTEVRKFGGKQAADFEVVAFDEAKRFGLRNTSGPFDLERVYEFEPSGPGTAITFAFTMRPKGLPYTLLFPLLRPVIAGQVRTNIQRLAGLLD